jgi:hypothetical protein
VRYGTFDPEGEEVLRLAFEPKAVTAGGRPLPRTSSGPGWTFDPRTSVLRVRREGARQVAIDGGPR